MEIHLPQDQQALLEGLVAAGRFRTVDEAVAAGVRLLASTERLCGEVQRGVEQANRDEIVGHDTVFARLRALAALAAGDDSR